MKLIIGLGNPGEEYRRTRHNVGFAIVDRFADRFRLEFDGHQKDAFTARGRVAGQAVMLAKPQTFMNLSGKAVGGLVRAHLESLHDLMIIYDDIDLPLGCIRIRETGSAGSHNGMKSIIDSLGTSRFPRLRFGIRGESWSAERDLAATSSNRSIRRNSRFWTMGCGLQWMPWCSSRGVTSAGR